MLFLQQSKCCFFRYTFSIALEFSTDLMCELLDNEQLIKLDQILFVEKANEFQTFFIVLSKHERIRWCTRTQ